MLLLAATMLLAGACMKDEPDWESMALVSHADAQASRAQTEAHQAEARIYTEQARAAQAQAEAALAQAQATNATANAEYAYTLRDAIGGLVEVTNQAQGLLAIQTMLPYAIIGGLVVALIMLGIVGIYLLRYQLAAAQAQRAMWDACVQRLELERGQSPVLFIRPGVRAERESMQEG
ncbi:MAG: hypothetical protein KKA73_30430 [Chloroflexi bacterium]|nr:hypothetical protein [Chloroflexota bacterium]MBU1752017.1 hypothetical protein [Chloroflexota bacterium]